MLAVALLNAMGREGRGNHSTELVLILACGVSGTTEKPKQTHEMATRGMSGHDLAREPGLGEQRDHQLG